MVVAAVVVVGAVLVVVFVAIAVVVVVAAAASDVFAVASAAAVVFANSNPNKQTNKQKLYTNRTFSTPVNPGLAPTPTKKVQAGSFSQYTTKGHGRCLTRFSKKWRISFGGGGGGERVYDNLCILPRIQQQVSNPPLRRGAGLPCSQRVTQLNT